MKRNLVGTHRSVRLLATAGAALLAIGALSATAAAAPTAKRQGVAHAGSSALGKPNPATGPAITIGLLTDAGSGTLDQTAADVEKGTKIAQQYVNDYLGGIGGHKVELFACGDKATPAGAQDCANQFVDKKVSAVIYPTISQSAGVPIITGAGIPIIAGNGSSSAELTSPGVFILTGGYPGILGAYAQDAKNLGKKKLANILIDVPAATGAANALGNIVFKNAGVGYEVIPAPPGTPDLTPQLQQAVSDGADALLATGDLTFCTSFFQAYQTLQLNQTKYIVGTCNDKSVVKAMPDALKGARNATLTASGSDQKLYKAMVNKYAKGKVDPDPNKSPGVSLGLGHMMTLASGLQGYTGNATAADILAHYSNGASGTLFLSGGIPFKCDGTAIPLLKNICSAQYQIAVLNGDGTTKSSQKVDAAAMYKS